MSPYAYRDADKSYVHTSGWSLRYLPATEPTSKHLHQRNLEAALRVVYGEIKAARYRGRVRNVFPSTRFRSPFFRPRRRTGKRGIAAEGGERERCLSGLTPEWSSETTPRELCRQCCWLPVHYDVIESSWYGMYLLTNLPLPIKDNRS